MEHVPAIFEHKSLMLKNNNLKEMSFFLKKISENFIFYAIS